MATIQSARSKQIQQTLKENCPIHSFDIRAELREYSGMDTTCTQLKTLNSQFNFFMKQKVAAKSNLIALFDQTYPGVNKLLQAQLALMERKNGWILPIPSGVV